MLHPPFSASYPDSVRRLIVVLGLETYALLLALLQLSSGVRTDEAKYLLDIPYPHPPVARWTFHLLDGWTHQELFWRIVLATLLVQAVWIVWSMVRMLPVRDRRAVCAFWLLSGPVILQAGTIMMAPLTALQGLVLVWLYLRRDIDTARFGGWLAVCWGLSLFTAFQAILFLPLVLALYRRTRLPLWFQTFCVLGPVFLLLLYVLGHPHAAASFLLVRGDGAGLSALQRAMGAGVVLGLAGSVWGSLLGVAGILFARAHRELLLTFILLCAYLLVSAHDYYAVLFLPLFVAGVTLLLRRWKPHPAILLTPFLLGTGFILWTHPLPLSPGPAQAVMEAVEERKAQGAVLIAGSFGHEWQYESMFPIRRYRSSLLRDAQAVVCLGACPDMQEKSDWQKMEGMEEEVWVRK